MSAAVQPIPVSAVLGRSNGRARLAALRNELYAGGERWQTARDQRSVTRGIPRQSDPHGGFNEHRNSSRVFPVPPDALLAALAALRALDPALRSWIEDGHPRLTEAEHVARFGEPYARSTPKRAAKSGHTGGTTPLT